MCVLCVWCSHAHAVWRGGAGVRNKPGRGLGAGVGVRMDSPVGPVRLEYAWNEAKLGRFHVGLGYA